MKKRILSILLLCCMVLTLLPVTVSAATTGAMDNIPSRFDKEIDLVNEKGDINIGDSKTYYIYSSSNDPEWVWTKKIQINGKKAAPHIFLDNVNIQVKGDAKTPAIELHGKASAYLYFINRDSKLTGGGGRAAIQKNRSEGQLCVQVMRGTTVTCQGGYSGAGIGGSYAIRYFGTTYYNIDMYGHGVNMHFGSQTNPSLWSGTIIAKGGKYSAGIGGGRNGSGEKLYFYSGKIEATGGEMGAGIGGSYEGRGRDIYIYGGDISATGGTAGAGIGGGCWRSEQDMDGDTAAYNINIYGGKVYACGSYNGAGIGGGQFVPARDITITGGEVNAHGAYGAAIGGGRWCHGQNITVTDAKLKLTTGYNQFGSNAAAMGYGDLVYSSKVYSTVLRYIGDFVRNPLPEDYKSIKIGSYNGKLIKLKVEAQAINRNDDFTFFWNLYDILIPNENGRIDVQLLTLPYVKNYGWAINAMELELIDDPCNGKHDFGWVDRQSCHVWACRNMKCQARDPVAPESARNGKHASSGWNTEKHRLLCDVCGHVMETDTKAPVLEVLKDGEIYTAEDVRDEKTLEGKPGAYTFTVSDPAASGETSSGIKSVTINDVEQTVGSTYSLPAPDGGNNDAGNEYTVVATDNAGNQTTATVTVYRRHRVQVISPDGSKTYVDKLLAHNEYLILTMKLPEDAAVKLTDRADGTEIPYDKEKKQFVVGLINRSRTLLLEYSTVYPQVELELGQNQRFTGYSADTDETYYLKAARKDTDNNRYSVAVRIDTTNATEPGCYFSSPKRYTQEQLAEMDKQGEIPWIEYKHPDPEPGVIIIYRPEAHIDAAEYDANGSWYIYAKAKNVKGTAYVSTPNLTADVEAPKAIDLSTGEELKSSGRYYGDLRFRVEEESPFTVWYRKPQESADYTVLLPDEDGYYTIPADYESGKDHNIFIEDACGNKSQYLWLRATWNYLMDVGQEGRYWDEPTVLPLRISKTQKLEEELSKIKIGVKSAHSGGNWMLVDVDWTIPGTYDPNSPREQTFTVNGTVILAGTKDNEKNLSELDVVPCPGEEWKKNLSVQVTVEGDPQYKVTIADCANGTVTTNAAQTDADGTPLFYAGNLVMLSVVPDEGYRLKSLLVEEADSGLAVDHDDADAFIQPAADVRIIAEFEEIRAVKPTAIRVTGEYVYNGGEQLANVEGYDAETMNIDGNTATDAGTYTVSVTSKTGRWTDGTTDAATAQWRIERAEQEAPDGLQGVGPTTEGGSDGKITGTDTSMEYRAAAEASYTACTGSEIENLTAGSYFVRYAEDRNHFASPDTEVVVGEGEARSFTITFNANGGTGSMEPVTVEEGSRYVLPACGFTAPDGQEFKAWEIGGVEYNAGDGYVVLGNTEIKALWKDSTVIPTTFTITFNANGGTGSMEPVTVEEGSRYPLPACGFTAPAGQEFKAWEIGGIEYNAGDGYVVLGNTEIKALWKDSAVIPTTFTITFNANGGTGSMEPVTVEEGSRYVLPACGFTAPAGQEFKAWEIGGIEYNAGDDYVVLGNTEIKALWKDSAVIPTTFTITFNANGGTGSMEPVTVEEGSRYPLPACGFIPPVNMQFSGWALSADGSVIADGAIMVTSNITLYAIWEPVPVNEFVVFFDGNGGTPAVSSMTTIGHRLAFLPGAFRSGSYRFDGWYTERNGGELITTSTVFAANTIVYAHWTYTGGSGGSGGYVPGYYIIRATAGAGGSITPSGDVSVRAGANQTFTITPNRGYAVSDVKIDGRSIGAVRSYTFENISASHTIEVQFRVRSSFVDVPSGSYYEDAVDWAVANGITTGTDAAHFSPDGICTRAQAVTFLWRAAGRPAPESRTMPFTDVPADSYYYDAVLWAVENGITKGTSSTTFSPDDTCTRAQIVTFLWRSEQSPAAGSSNPFTDVSADAYYADAVLWAVKEAITTGTTRTTFNPDAECTRAQIVTFLWRCKK